MRKRERESERVVERGREEEGVRTRELGSSERE